MACPAWVVFRVWAVAYQAATLVEAVDFTAIRIPLPLTVHQGHTAAGLGLDMHPVGWDQVTVPVDLARLMGPVVTIPVDTLLVDMVLELDLVDFCLALDPMALGPVPPVLYPHPPIMLDSLLWGCVLSSLCFCLYIHSLACVIMSVIVYSVFSRGCYH